MGSYETRVRRLHLVRAGGLLVLAGAFAPVPILVRLDTMSSSRSTSTSVSGQRCSRRCSYAPCCAVLAWKIGALSRPAEA